MSKENFKNFVSKNPSFANSVNSGKISWQKMYELYDLYGEENKIWNDYRSVEKATESAFSIKSILNSFKGINLESFQNNISSLQKAVGFLEDLTRDSDKKKENKKKKKELDPMDRFYSD